MEKGSKLGRSNGFFLCAREGIYGLWRGQEVGRFSSQSYSSQTTEHAEDFTEGVKEAYNEAVRENHREVDNVCGRFFLLERLQ